MRLCGSPRSNTAADRGCGRGGDSRKSRTAWKTSPLSPDPVPMPRPSSFDYAQLLECGHGQMFGPGNARLPLPPMLMFDRITEISTEGGRNGKGVIRAELDIRPDLWFFACHFEGDPVMPGCLG